MDVAWWRVLQLCRQIQPLRVDWPLQSSPTFLSALAVISREELLEYEHAEALKIAYDAGNLPPPIRSLTATKVALERLENLSQHFEPLTLVKNRAARGRDYDTDRRTILAGGSMPSATLQVEGEREASSTCARGTGGAAIVTTMRSIV